jgi:hypothetical protein
MGSLGLGGFELLDGKTGGEIPGPKDFALAMISVLLHFGHFLVFFIEEV